MGRYTHYLDQTCQTLRPGPGNTSTEGLFGCMHGGDKTPANGKAGSKMMAFGPATIVQTTYSDRVCSSKPIRTSQFLAYVCHDTTQGSEMVDKDAHHYFSNAGCQGKETTVEL